MAELIKLEMGFCKAVSLDCGKVYPEKKLNKYLNVMLFFLFHGSIFFLCHIHKQLT